MTPPELAQAARRGVLVAVGFVVVALALAAAAATLSEKGPEAWAIARTASPWALLLAWAVMTGGMVGLAFRWRAFFPPDVRAGVVPLTAILFIGMLLNYALPGPVGEVAGAALAGRRFKMSPEAALAAGITARFVGLALAGLAALGMVESGAVALPDGFDGWIRTATALVAAAAVTLAGLGARPEWLAVVADRTVGRVPRLAGLHRSLLHFATALRALGRAGPRTYLRGAAWAAFGHAAVVAGIWVAGAGLGAPPLVPGLVFTYAASTAGAIALFAFPGGQVGWDAMFVSLLVSTAGVDLPHALALTLVVRVHQLSLVMFGSALLVRELRDGTEPVVG